MEFTQAELRIYRQALKDQVCSVCHQLGDGEVCGGDAKECPFDRHLVNLLTAVLSTPRSNHIADYVPKIRELVCRHCPNQDEQGRCELRDQAYCDLDSLLVLVVQTIEEVSDTLCVAADH